MPPSVRARRSRRGSDHEEASDGGVRGESTPSTPSRPMRKRQRTQTPPTKVSVPSKKKRSRGSEAPDGQAEEDASGPDGLLNSVIANLNAAPHPVNVAEEHGNAKLEREYKHGVQAYAKIAGVNWTYYVKSLKINIGRPPESAAPSAGTITQSSPVVAGPASTVNINLGPHKAVSRQHATIEYNPEGAAAGWQMSVYGRLGAKINDRKLEIGDTQALHSGDVLEIDGTQMMFVTPNDGPRIHPMFLPGSTAHAEQGEKGVGSCDNDNDNDNDDDNDHNEEDDQSAVPAANTSRPRKSASLHHHHHYQQQRSGTANRALAQQPGSVGPKRPTTPGQANGSPEDQGHGSRPSPAYNRGLMLESTEGIDFSLESAKDFKPPFSYAAMIGQAIMASEEQKLTLNAIYQWIMDKYAFYRRSQSGWQNSIRHNLSLNKAFEKIPRRTDEPGKGMKWQIVPQHREEFTKRSLRPSTKGAHRTSSAPQSPAPKDMAAAAAAAASASAAPMASTSASASASAAAKTARTTTVTAPSSTMPGTGAVTGLGLALEDGREMSIAAAAMRLSPGSVTPPRHGSYPVAAREAYTPERGSHRPAGVREREDGTGSFADGSPMPMSRSRLSAFCSSTFSDGAQGSPLTLPSSAFMDESRPLITPAPRRQLVHLGPPSTAQVPSTFLPQSSPAPFWKYVDFGSTPAKPVPDPSPIKTGGGVGLQSSSPPPRPATFVDMESPSKATRADRDAGREGPADSGDDDDNLSDGDEPLDDMRGGIDLARGFQPIGSFQAKMTNAAV